jgi:membrane protease YdiL (CAAX protease family)
MAATMRCGDPGDSSPGCLRAELAALNQRRDRSVRRRRGATTPLPVLDVRRAGFQYAITVGILLLIARGLPLREVFALRRPNSWAVGAGLVVAGYLAILVVGGVLGLFLNATEEQGLVPDDWDSNRAGAFIAFFLTVTVLGPVVEELTYRGLGFGLLAPYGAVVAVTVTAVLFGVGHGLLIALPVLTAFGFVLGFLRARTESVYPPMILHGIFNGIALVVSLAVLD